MPVPEGPCGQCGLWELELLGGKAGPGAWSVTEVRPPGRLVWKRHMASAALSIVLSPVLLPSPKAADMWRWSMAVLSRGAGQPASPLQTDRQRHEGGQATEAAAHGASYHLQARTGSSDVASLASCFKCCGRRPWCSESGLILSWPGVACSRRVLRQAC